MTDDDWMKVALEDVTLVADVLCCLKESKPYYDDSTPASVDLPPTRWGNRKRRSKKLIIQMKNYEIRTMGSSPKTPLSWSNGSTSPSNGYEESSRNSDRSSVGRSKGTLSHEVNTSCARKSKQKKSYAELEEEESLLVKEMSHLKMEQRQRSENFKRIKLDFHAKSANRMHPTFEQTEPRFSNQTKWIEASKTECGCSVSSRHAEDKLLSCDGSQQQKSIDASKKPFVLPDLNMIPPEEFVPDVS